MADGLGGFEPVNPDRDKVIKAHLQLWALQKLAETNGPAEDTGAICQVSGIFRYPASVGGFLWLSGSKKVLMISTNINVAHAGYIPTAIIPGTCRRAGWATRSAAGRAIR